MTDDRRQICRSGRWLYDNITFLKSSRICKQNCRFSGAERPGILSEKSLGTQKCTVRCVFLSKIQMKELLLSVKN